MLLAIPALAQDAAQQDQPAAGAKEQRRGGAFLEELTQKLSLTPDQVTQVKAINGATAKQMRALQEDASLAEPDRRAKAKSIRQDQQSKIRALLTPDQQTKYDALLAEQRAKYGQRGNRGGGGSTAPAEPPQ